jgi:hypothetical protein
MERNSSVEQIVRFKKSGFERSAEVIRAHAALYPGVNEEQWEAVLQGAVSMMAGLWPLANPGHNVLEALRHPDVNQPPWDFKSLMVRNLSSMIKGQTRKI